ncbi:spermidine synthase [Fimbriiglobus ruber]|uniref:spermidine synthase n=1 Tax=Fimbriiglobus ruber TaxID=1908690 RepID=UPI00117BA0EE|nr:hypothetical protein [Fimbriiglobus ruber]
MPVLFAVTLFVSATLLFMVQPMVGKMILPLLGGSPAAWNTCMVFFQGLLLLGYLYAHNLSTKYTPARQTVLHLCVLGATVAWLAAAAVLSPNHSPVAVFKSLAPQGYSYPMFGVLALLGVAIGIPFLVISTSAPLLQRWFAYSGHPSAKDPYFLYAASNAGSLISLLGYPLVIEPSLSLANQAWLWAGGFVLLIGLVYLCGQAAKHPLLPPGKTAAAGVSHSVPDPTDPGPPPLLRKLRWMGLAFVPSSLMLGVTFHMTTDIASVPLLWVIPLALYLITFIIAYAHTPWWFRPVLGNVSPVLTLLLVFVLVSNVGAKMSQFFLLLLHIGVYFFTALLMHTELARERPHPNHLTGYFLWISIGGVLGGIFNALIAPVAFTQSYEYPIAIAIGCLLVPVLDGVGAGPQSEGRKQWGPWLDAIVPVGMVAFVGVLTLAPEKTSWFTPSSEWVARNVSEALHFCGLGLTISNDTVTLLVIYALPCMLCFFFIDRPIRFGLCVGAVLFVCYYRAAKTDDVEVAERSFFGILRVNEFRESGRFDFAFPVTGGTSGETERTDDYVVFFNSQTDKKTGEKEPYGFVLNRDIFHKLSHGTTLHGMQTATSALLPIKDRANLFGAFTPWDTLVMAGAQGAWDSRQEPLTYYHRSGPVGGIFHRFRAIDPTGDVAMVGLGTGSAACYARPGQKLTFYEIDPTVIKLVEKPWREMNPDEVKNGAAPRMGPFTFVDDARKRGATVDFLVGDARLKLEEFPDRKYGLLLIDAFSSDSIPVHLLTREAVELYKSRLTEHGLLALHISNRYIALGPVVARLAQETGLASRVWNDTVPNGETRYPGKTSSSWVILAKSDEDLGDEILGTVMDERVGAVAGGFAYLTVNNPGSYSVYNHPWRQLNVLDEVPAWTDDYSDVLRVMQIHEIRWVRKKLGLPVPKLGHDDGADD